MISKVEVIIKLQDFRSKLVFIASMSDGRDQRFQGVIKGNKEEKAKQTGIEGACIP